MELCQDYILGILTVLYGVSDRRAELPFPRTQNDGTACVYDVLDAVSVYVANRNLDGATHGHLDGCCKLAFAVVQQHIDVCGVHTKWGEHDVGVAVPV